MKIVREKARKAIRKTLKKVINKHAATVEEHLATALTAAVATYLGAQGKKGAKKLTKITKKLPGGKKVGNAVAAAVPAFKNAAGKLPAFNNDDRGSHHRSKKRASS